MLHEIFPITLGEANPAQQNYEVIQENQYNLCMHARIREQ